MTDFNWGQADGAAASGGFSGYPVQQWWDTAGGGGSGTVVSLAGPTPTPSTDKPATPGGFNLDITSPGATLDSIKNTTLSQQTFIDSIGQALFNKEGSILGGIPGVGDLGRFIGDNPIGQAIGNVVRGGINLAGDALERIPSGNADLTPDYQKASPVIRQAYDKQIADDPGRAQHLMYQALQDQAKIDQQTTPNLFWDLQVPTGSLADSVGRILGLLAVPARGFVQRTAAGAVDRLGQIEDRVLTGNGSQLSPVEAIAYSNWKSNTWTQDQALDFLASNSAGFSSDPLVQLGGEVFLDPLLFLSLGATALAKIGAAGVRLSAAGTATYKAAGTSARFDLLGKAGESELFSGLLRNYGTHVYSPLETSQIGKVAKIARTIIDPFHAIGQNRAKTEALVDVLAETAVRALRDSVGNSTALDVLRTAGVMTGGFQDRLLAAEATYAANLARGAVMTGHRDAAMAFGAAEQLRNASQREILDALLASPAPRDLSQLLRHEMDRVGVATLDEGQMRDLATGLARMHGGMSADEMLKALRLANDDALTYLHGIAYGQAITDFLRAKQAAMLAPYTGPTPLVRLNLMNRSTLAEVDLRELVELLREEVADDILSIGFTGTRREMLADYRIALLAQAKGRFPALAYLTLPEGRTKIADIERLIAHLEHKLESGTLPIKVTEDELSLLPAPVREWKEQYPTRDIGFEPSDDLKWNMGQDPLTGKWYSTGEPWNDLVSHEGPVYRPLSARAYNFAGMPVEGRSAGLHGVPVMDAMESAARTWKQKIDARMVLANAQARMTRLAVRGKAGVEGLSIKGGATEAEARQIFRGVQSVAQLDRHTARGLSEQSLWDKMQPLLPKRLEHEVGWTPRDLRNLVLASFEGDFRVVGITQKITGRAKSILGFKGNYAGYVSEHLYPDIRFAKNPLFQIQEKMEPLVWLAGRGITPVLGRSMTAADRAFARVADRAAETGVMRAADLAEMAEYSSAVLAGGGRIAGLLHSKLGRTLDMLTDVGGQRRVSMLRVQQANLGRPIRESMQEHTPGLWERMAAHYSQQAGGVLDDNEVALRWLAEQSLGNKVSVENIVDAGTSYADFRNATISEPYLPANLGEIKPLNLDWLSEMLEMRLGPDHIAGSPNELVAALRRGDLVWEDIAAVMSRHGFQPEYISRVKRALEFDWDDFWIEVKGKFDAQPAEIRDLQAFVSKVAKSHGATPVEYLSQIVLPEVREGFGAIVGNLGDALAILRAPREGATFDDLVDQLAKVLNTHLDPSGREALLAHYGDNAEQLADAFRARIRSGVPHADPEVERAFRMFSLWSEDAIAKGLWLGEGHYADLLGEVFKLPREGAAPFNMNHQLLVNRVAQSLREGHEDAFRLLYFKQSRGLLERSANHPFLAIYPASYMWGKVLPEMIRFITREPFGLHTGAAAYALNDASLSLAAQREWDPEFDTMLDKVGRSEALWWLGYLLPAVPWDVGAAWPSWMRNIARQAMENQQRVDRGLKPKPIDLNKAIGTIADYTSLVRGYKQIGEGAGAFADLLKEQEPETEPVSKIIKPTPAAAVGEAVTSAQQQLSQLFNGKPLTR